MTPNAWIPSNSQVKKAGRKLRRLMRDGDYSLEEFNAAVEVVEAHRAAHQTPLVTANNGLRSMVSTTRCNGKVTQRLKRMPTILEKIEREPTLSLDRMQDIGGCRVVLVNREEVYRLRAHILGRRKVIREDDYVASPRSSGYRGIHLVSEYGTTPKPIEIQLRTQQMHNWALAVEDFSGRLGQNYKQDGDTPLQRLLECLSRIMERDELGETVSNELLDEYSELYAAVFPIRKVRL